MARNPNTSFFHTIFFTLWLLILLWVGFVTAWTFIYLQDPRESRRPAFNLKEL